MKKLLMAFALSIGCMPAMYAQSAGQHAGLSAGTIQYLHNLQEARTNGARPQGYVYKKINNRDYISAFIKVAPAFDGAALSPLGVFVGTKAGNIWTVQIPVERVQEFTAVPGIVFIDLDAPVSPSLDYARKYTKADSAQAGYGLPMPMTGKGVIMGVIDAGFDFNHPTFYDTTHSMYRVKKVWSQKVAGTPPAGFSYGSEMTDTDVIRAAGYDTAITPHGTHVAGIAGGSGYSSTSNRRFRGMAFESDLVFVGIMPAPGQWAVAGESDIVDGMNYIYNYAASVGKPCVVNLSWGSTIGPHDGLSLFSQACDALTGPGKIFVCAAGNNGEDTVHLQKTFTATDTSVSTFVTFSPALAADNQRTWVDVWGDTSKTFCVNFRLYNGATAIDSTGPVCIDGAGHSYTLVGSNGDTCFVSVATIAAEYNGKPHVYVSIYSRVPDNICMTTTGTDGKVDVWEGYVYPPVGYYGALKALDYPWAVSGDVHMTVSDIGCTRSAITVAAHNTKTGFLNISGASLSYGSSFGIIAPFSSFGPTRDNRIKPDIAAPGFAIASSINSYDTAYAPGGTSYNTVISATTIGGRTYSYAMAAGTSMAAPCASGIIAMLLQMVPTLTPDSVKTIIFKNAIVDSYTGSIPAAGNTTWGHGKINAYKSTKYLAQFLSVQHTLTPDPLDCLLYPNPSKGSFTIDFVSKTSDRLTIEVSDIAGKVVSRQYWYVSAGANTKQFFIPTLSEGVYFTKISSGDKYNVIKTVIE